MAKNVSLLLLDTVDSLGIVGDVVSVRSGYARNYLLPRGLASEPNEELMKSLASKREEAERQLRELRAQREKMIEKLEGYEVTLVRSCNDLGMLYGSVTQKDIADALTAQGFKVTARDVRLGQTIKRVDNYHVTVKLDRDLEADVTVHVKPDRELETSDRDAEGGQDRSYAVAEIAGMDEKNAAKLVEAGIRTTGDLLRECADPKGRRATAERTGIDASTLLQWANFADLMRLKGVGGEYARLLEAAGVDTVKELRQRDAANLAAKLAEVNEASKLVRRVPGVQTVSGWIEEARNSEAALSY